MPRLVIATLALAGCTYDPSRSVTSSCPPGQFATDVSATGLVSCTAVDLPIRSAIDDHCSVYLGWRDSCDGCTTPPTNLGSSGTVCDPGVGANTCTTPTLAGTPTSLFGLDLSGGVNNDDKFYGSLHCSAAPPVSGLAPCGAGQVVVGRTGSSWTCASPADAVVDYVSNNCALYLGWQDACDGCTTDPVKWGRAGDGSCLNGAGADNTCGTAVLGTETINLFGLNTDGTVNDDDKFHVGLDCVAPSPMTTTSTTTCDPGQFVVGTEPDGGFRCESIASRVADYFDTHCTLTFGWQDHCDGCLSPPTKFGSVRVGTCTLGTGDNDTCGTFTLGGQSVDLFGLNTDGTVDDDDTLYVGFHCN